MFQCLDCNMVFSESEMKIREVGSGAVLSKTEYVACPDCESETILDLDSGKIQKPC